MWDRATVEFTLAPSGEYDGSISAAAAMWAVSAITVLTCYLSVNDVLDVHLDVFFHL